MTKIKKIWELNNPKMNEVYGIRDDADTHPDNLPEITGKAGSPIIDISVSPDGKNVASVDGRIHIWDYNGGRRKRSFFSPTRLTSVSFTSDGKYVVSGNVNGNIQVWDVDAGKINREFLK
jgi:WD40 repeat protein